MEFERDFLTPKELAKYWHIEEQTLQKWRCRAYGPIFQKKGRLVRYYKKHIIEFERNSMYRGTGEKITPKANGGTDE